MSLHLVERAEAAVGRSNAIYTDAVATPFIPHGGQSRIPEVLSSATITNMADSIQNLNVRVSKVENMVLSLESTIMRGMSQKGGPATGPTGYGGLFQTNSVSDLHEAIHGAMAPVRDSLRQHEKLICDLVTAMNSLDAWKVAASASQLSRGSSPDRKAKETVAHKQQDTTKAAAAEDSSRTFLDAETRLKRLRTLAASISELPSIPLVAPSTYVGHKSTPNKKKKNKNRYDDDNEDGDLDVSPQRQRDLSVHGGLNNSNAAGGGGGFGSMADHDGDDEDDTSGSATTNSNDQSNTNPYNAVHDMSSGGDNSTHQFRTLLDVTDVSATESEGARGGRGAGEIDLMSRVQRILGGGGGETTSAGDFTGDERNLLAETSSNSDAYRDLIQQMQMRHQEAGHTTASTSD